MKRARQRTIGSMRSLCRAARRALYALMAPRWVGTRTGLRGLIRRRLRPLHGRAALLAQVAQGGAIVAMVAGMLGLTAPLEAEAIDLLNLPPLKGVEIGLNPEFSQGSSVSGAGDVNGDGLADYLVGTSEGGGPDGLRTRAGTVYVLYGKRTGLGDVDFDNFSASDGFVIHGPSESSFMGFAVSGAGDVNGDGFDDVLVSASGVKPPPGTPGDTGRSVGACYVIFGEGTGREAVDLASLSSAEGYRILGYQQGRGFGLAVSGVGDINGDGFADIAMSAPRASFPESPYSYAGEIYVIFGKATGFQNINLGNLSSIDGFSIRGGQPQSGWQAGTSISGIGDFNGDGLDDMLIGAPGASRPEAPFGGFGSAFVIFGRTDGSANLQLMSLVPEEGVQLLGVDPNDRAGREVSGLGDINGDGFADVLVGAPQGYGPNNTRTAAGDAFVVFGRPSGQPLIDLATLALPHGFVIHGRSSSDSLGRVVSGAGDINGDGFNDILVGSPNAKGPSNDRPNSGEVYVVFGKPGFPGSVLDLHDMWSANGFNDWGFIIFGATDKGIGIERSTKSLGDVTGDGIADYGVLSRGSSPTAYVLYGSDAATSSSSHRHIAAGDAPRTPIGIIGDGSNASSPNSRCWIEFAGGAGPGGGASREIATITRSGEDILDLNGKADVRWNLQSNRSAVSSLVTFQYLDSEIVGLEEEELGIYFATSPSGPWVRLSSETTLDTDRNLITARAETFGHFTIAAAMVDSDGDGLADAWEMEGGGIDINGDGVIDLSLWDLGARPDRKDLFLEIDSTRDFFVSDTAVGMLVEAFANAPVNNPDGSTGITLHIERSDVGIASDEVVAKDDADWPVNFDTIKDEFFGTFEQRADSNAEHILAAKRLAYRYCLIYGKTTTGEGGQARDFYCADFYYCQGFARERFLAGTFTQEDVDYDAATSIMHELGHALGLRHGGGDDINGKPNYPSIMNYSLVDRADWNKEFWRLDFCRVALPPLFENSIDERIGFKGGAEYREFFMPISVSEEVDGQTIRKTVNESLSDDWLVDVGRPGIPNGTLDGQFSDGIVQDLNYTGEEGGLSFRQDPTPGEVMVGYNDWDLLRYEVPRGQRARRTSPPQEDPWEVIREFHDSLPIPPPPPPPRKRDSWAIH